MAKTWEDFRRERQIYDGKPARLAREREEAKRRARRRTEFSALNERAAISLTKASGPGHLIPWPMHKDECAYGLPPTYTVCDCRPPHSFESN